jgi:hypothetical protein
MQAKQLIDDCFHVEESRWKTWSSFDTEGKKIITSLDEDACVHATRFYLKGLQEGFGEVNVHQGTVDGKL